MTTRRSHFLFVIGVAGVSGVTALAGSSCGKAVIDHGSSSTYAQETVTSSSSSGSGEESLVTCYQDEYHEPTTPPPAPKVDVLFVVSTAESFDPYRIEVGNNVKSWVNALPPGVDYRFAVMLAHAEDCWSGALFPGCDGPLVLRSDQLSLSQIGEYLANRIVINPGEVASDGGEAFTISLQKSLTETNAAKIQQEGFYRADAALEVVTMTARNDICWTAVDYPGGVKPTSDPFYAVEQAERAQECTGYSSTAAVSAIEQFKGSQAVTGAAFAFTPSSTIPSGSTAVIGYTELSFMNQLGGSVIPLDQPTQFVAGLDLMQPPLAPSGLQTQFALRTTEALLNSSTLTVTIDGNAATYALNSSTMELTLSASSVTSLNLGSVVDIDYCTVPTGPTGSVLAETHVR